MLPIEGGELLDWRLVLFIIALICFVISFIVAYKIFQVQESSVPSKMVSLDGKAACPEQAAFFCKDLR
ncbi:MAG: hypothetical protein AA931_02240 [Peptococcaceae bacterium 1109]|jgi:hypothetical protein|nr:MAG: hypothetical protein AA931_02240 [Peptococcaceae bacterium 1109]